MARSSERGGFLLYGVTGYTGRLCAERSVELGMRPVIAARRPDAVREIAARLQLPWRSFELGDPTTTAEVAQFDAVLHCAGPFSRTSAPMVESCLRARTHYLDINGELDVFEAVFRRDREARSAGVVLLPGVGFDVVPSDCLAAMLASEVADAVELEIAVGGFGGLSRGTLRTALELLAAGGRVRRDGVLVSVPIAGERKVVDFPQGPREVVLFPLADVSSAYRSTEIPNITGYVRLSEWMVRALPIIRSLIGFRSIGRMVEGFINRLPPGPRSAARQRGKARVWARVRDARGRGAEATLEVPEAYRFTVETALESVRRVLAGEVAAGATTPSRAFGPGYVTTFPGVELRRAS